MSHTNSKPLPPQTGAYSVKIKKKNCDNWRQFDTVRLEISVGQPYHEGDKLSAAIEWAQNRFRHVHVLVNDSLQRYNLMFEQGYDEATALRISNDSGEDWLHRNKTRLRNIPAGHIHRWEKWRNSSEFSDDITKAENLYKSRPDFRRAIEGMISNHWQRRLTRISPDLCGDKTLYWNLSRNYLIEETAIFSQIYRSIPGVSIYPGSFMEIWDMFQGCDAPEIPKGLDSAHWLRIDFARNNNKPQAHTMG